MMMEASFDTEESFDDPSCLAPQPAGSVSPAKRQIREVKETKITVSTQELQLDLPLLFLSSSICFCPLLSLHLHPLSVFKAPHVAEKSASFFLLSLVLLPSVDIVFNLTAQIIMHCGFWWSNTGFPANWKPH